MFMIFNTFFDDDDVLDRIQNERLDRYLDKGNDDETNKSVDNTLLGDTTRMVERQDS